MLGHLVPVNIRSDTEVHVDSNGKKCYVYVKNVLSFVLITCHLVF